MDHLSSLFPPPPPLMSDFSTSLVAGDTGSALTQEAQIIAAISAMEGTIIATRFVSALAVAVLLYDHILTLGDEIELIWCNQLATTSHRVAFMMNRYLTEVMVLYVGMVLSGTDGNQNTGSCHTFIWIFTVFSILFVGGSHLVLMGQLYILWDRRPTIRWILCGSFVLAMGCATLFFFLAGSQVQSSTSYNPLIRMCTFTQKPWAMDFALVTLTIFDLFIIIMTISNGFHRPYKTESEVLLALLRDGAGMFVALFLLRVANLLMGLFGGPIQAFITLIFIWSMCSIVSSRIQLRVEAFNIGRLDEPEEEIEEEEVAIRPKLDPEWDPLRVMELKVEHSPGFRSLVLKPLVIQPPAPPSPAPVGDKFSLKRAISRSASTWFD
ncbi:hypothetical protein C8R46DRAFT_333944 [Mycena filopes]|nr:hypothetical protein C8R46DRAFT_333944 [Mycena filopes]